MMLYKNTRAMIHTPDSDDDFFDIVAGVLASFLFVSRLHTMNVYRSNYRKWFHTKKCKKQTKKLLLM